jgi:hypothetical protein
MEIRAEEISEIIRKQIEEYDQKVAVLETGTVLTVGDGIARVHGLDGAMAGELLDFPHGVKGMILNLEEDNVGVALLGRDTLMAAWSTLSASPSTARARSRPKTSPIELKAPGIVEAPAGERAAADRHQGHRRDDPHRPRPARADHRRPPDRQDRDRHRHHHQPEGQDVTASTSPSARSSRRSRRWSRRSRARRDGLHHRRERLRLGGPALQFIAPYAGCAMAEYLMRQGQARARHLRRPVQAGRGLPPALAAAAPPAGPRGLPGRRLLPAQPPARARGQAERREGRRLAHRRCRSSRPRPATCRPTSRPT